MNAGEAAQRGGEMAVGPGVIHGPVRAPLAPVPFEVEAAAPRSHRRVHQPREGPLGFLPIVRRNGIVRIFQTRVFPPRLLCGIQCTD